MTTGAVFITGGFGFLGQYIVQAVHDHDPQAELHVLVRTPRSTHLPIREMARVRLITGDLARPVTFASELDGVETVIHNAALVSFKKGDADELIRSNIVGTEALFEAAIAHGCRNFIFISSISAVGRRAGQLSDETMIPNLAEKRAADPYGYSKLVGEQYIQGKADRIRVVILNPSVIIGPGSRRIESVSRLLRWLPVFPMISTINSFVDVRDVADAAVLAIARGQSGERYIVTTENVDMLTFTRAALRVIGKKAPVFPIPSALLGLGDILVEMLDFLRLNPGFKKISALNVDKAYTSDKIRRDLGWQPRYSLEQSLRDTLVES